MPTIKFDNISSKKRNNENRVKRCSELKAQ